MLCDSRVLAKQLPFKEVYGSGAQGFPSGRNTNEGMAELEDFERIPSLAFSV
jgi:hypothetical protein